MWYDDFWSLKIKMSPRSAFGEVSCYSEHYTSRINILYSATYIHISVNSAVELLSRDTALIRNHKSTLIACFKALPIKRFIPCAVLTCAFSKPVHLKSAHEKARQTASDNWTKLSFVLILSKHTRFWNTYFWNCFVVLSLTVQINIPLKL